MDFDKETMKSLMIDHIDGKITGELAKYVELHIDKNPNAKAEYDELKEIMELISKDKEVEVPEAGKSTFLQMAQEEMNKPPIHSRKVVNLSYSSWLKIAAAIAFVIIGYLGAQWFNRNTKDEMIALQSELNKTKELVMISMMKQGSASERLKGIFASTEINNVNEDIIDALILAMNADVNINVRIAAADALSRFSDNEKARLALIASLNQQSFPAVQMKLIDILVNLGDKNALNPMREFSEKEDVLRSVKDEAHMGIFKLL